jgi:diguanylate cyclase (GGDEF)-like protein
MIDVDHFKTVNDRFGHAAGDKVLIAVSQALTAATRAEDRLGRWGGEEFVLLLRETEPAAALRCAERCREIVEASKVHVGNESVTVTISTGVATLGPDGGPTTVEELLAQADMRMYQAKGAGRNCSVGGPATGDQPAPASSTRDRRRHARVETDHPCLLSAGNAPTEARIRDISRSGALVVGPIGHARAGAPVQLQLVMEDNAPPSRLAGRVVWTDAREGKGRYGVMFDPFGEVEQGALDRFVSSLLLGRGLGRRASPRLRRRIELTIQDRPEMRALMHDISRGGVGFISDVGVSLGEELQVELNLHAWQRPVVAVSGVVVHVQQSVAGQYVVGLHCPAPEAAVQKQIDDVLKLLATE